MTEKRKTRPLNMGLTSVSQNVYLQAVSSLSYFTETESNNCSSEAMPVGIGTTFGTIQTSSDEDWYLVNLEANKQYTISLRGLQQGDDLDLFLFNPDLSEEGASMSIGNWNENIVFTAATSGNYYVSTYCFSYATLDYHEYKLMIYQNDEFEPNNDRNTSANLSNGTPANAAINIDTDTDWYYVDVNDGRLTVTLDNIPYDCDYDITVYNESSIEVGGSYFSGNTSEKTNILVGNSGRYYIKVYPYVGSNPGWNYELRASVSNPDQYESNDFYYEARTTHVGSSIFATIDNIKDIDLFEIPIYQQNYYSFKLENIPNGNDYDLIVCDPEGNYLTSSRSFENADENITINLTPGNYTVQVVSYKGTSDTSSYNFSINLYSVLTVNLPDVNADAGDIIVIPVNIQNIPQEGISHFDARLIYDSNVLTYIDYQSGDQAALTGSTESGIMDIVANDASDGLRILYMDNSSTLEHPIINSGDVIKLRFQVNNGIADGVYQIMFSNDYAFGSTSATEDLKEVNILRFEQGSVTIGDFQATSLNVVEDSEKTVTVLEAFIYGDVNADGKLNSTDYALLKKFILFTDSTLENYGYEAYYAGDVATNGKVNSTDYARYKQYLLGTISLLCDAPPSTVIYRDGSIPITVSNSILHQYTSNGWTVVPPERDYGISRVTSNLDKLEALATRYILASGVDTPIKQLVLQYIRRGELSKNPRYTGGNWSSVAGKVDAGFVTYVNNYASELKNYFHDNVVIIDPLTQADVDFVHWAATLNALYYSTSWSDGSGLKEAFKAEFVSEYIIDDLSGWAGDLQSLAIETRREVGASNDYNTLYSYAYSSIGTYSKDPKHNFAMDDVLADIDAVNIKRLSNSLSYDFQTYYKNGGNSTRFSDFVEIVNKLGIYNDAQRYTHNYLFVGIFPIVWPLYSEDKEDIDKDGDTEEYILISINLDGAVAEAYTDFIWSKIEEE